MIPAHKSTILSASTPPFHRMVVMAWLRRSVTRPTPNTSGRYEFRPTETNHDRHDGRAAKIYRRFHSIIDRYT